MRRNYLMAGLTVACTALGCFGARAAAGLAEAPKTSAELNANTGGRPPSGNPLWAIPLSVLSATRERPIFLPSRRPPVPILAAPPVQASAPSPTPQAPEPDRPALQLLGTIIGTSTGIGIFFNPSARDVIRLEVGEAFEGWTLRSVHGRETTFAKDARSAVLSLPSPEDTKDQPLEAQNPALQVQTAVPQNHAAAPRPIPGQAQGGGTWMDGDGQMISPPPRQSSGR